MGYVYHISIRPHVSQQANKAALVELYEFLGDARPIKGIVIEIIPDEHISRNTSNMFLNQGILMSEIHDPVRGKDMFPLQAINTGRVCHVHIKMVIIDRKSVVYGKRVSEVVVLGG